MNKKQALKYCISTDKYNLLQDNENIILYSLKKLYYKLELYFRGYNDWLYFESVFFSKCIIYDHGYYNNYNYN